MVSVNDVLVHRRFCGSLIIVTLTTFALLALKISISQSFLSRSIRLMGYCLLNGLKLLLEVDPCYRFLYAVVRNSSIIYR